MSVARESAGPENLELALRALEKGSERVKKLGKGRAIASEFMFQIFII